MPERIQHLITDLFQIGVVYSVAIFISLQKFAVEFHMLGEFVKYSSFAIAGGYTAWKWYNESQSYKKKRNERPTNFR